MIKIFRNTFLAMKISYCNEIYQFCQNYQVNYEQVRKLAANDSRINHSHTYVPGPDGYTGYGGTCLPKDINSLKYQMDKIQMKSYIIQSIIQRNETVDRIQKDWINLKGRAVI